MFKVPGTVIAHSPAKSRRYIGSPTIVVTGKGEYVAAHDFFGPGTDDSQTVVYKSIDNGYHWQRVASLSGQWWSNLFMHRGELYIFGTSRKNGKIVIRRSPDKGTTWTIPEDEVTGLLTEEEGYHCAPMPITIYQGRLWRAFEKRERNADGEWLGSSCHALVISAPVDADLLNRNSWRQTNMVPYPGKYAAEGAHWREGNVVVDWKNHELLNIIRYEPDGTELVDCCNKAAILHVGDNGNSLSFNLAHDVINLPGGRSKFTIRYDEQTDLYWCLSNPFFKQYEEIHGATLGDKGRIISGGRGRNVLALSISRDLRKWDIKEIVLKSDDIHRHAFQYVDWQFDGDDIVIVSRTAYDDGLGGAHNPHNANFLTFHRIKAFRHLAENETINLTDRIVSSVS